ncbi:hypothetical protein NECAME_12176 [Necator americanus]|uniref:Uncharacterized protein n=1 Tax=Necator americanus TaxID=51031 RepID=W2T3E8_NECAM|nr:hypothetical protein NECAME_12176 [Necator americanus]ETN75746.1 hypothetical protein NECAME_12176 [Necator americanus]
MRRPNAYDKPDSHGEGTPPRMEEDWSIQPHSGYFSDHGYFPNSVQTVRQRRPRSATAMRPMTASEMCASRAHYRTVPEPLWDDVDISQEGRCVMNVILETSSIDRSVTVLILLADFIFIHSYSEVFVVSI